MTERSARERLRSRWLSGNPSRRTAGARGAGDVAAPPNELPRPAHMCPSPSPSSDHPRRRRPNASRLQPAYFDEFGARCALQKHSARTPAGRTLAGAALRYPRIVRYVRNAPNRLKHALSPPAASCSLLDNFDGVRRGSSWPSWRESGGGRYKCRSDE
uniref:Uncharacterized protein n=1 Tax=Plectus sambesii TaxID=2011161 RepID=A0A914VZA0_9BILA